MAYPTMGYLGQSTEHQPTEDHFETQESMFEDRSSYAVEEEIYGGSQEPSYDAHESLPETAPHAAHAAEAVAERELELPGSSSAAHAAAIRAAEAEPQPSPLAVLTVDDFAALEERILSAVSLVRRERQARVAAEDRAANLEAQLQDAQSISEINEDLRQEVLSLRAEREQVRHRVERLLGQLDALEL